MFSGQVVQHRAPAQGDQGRELTDDEAIAGKVQAGLRQAQLSICALPRTKLLCAEQDNLRNRLSRPAVEVHSGAGL